VTEAGVPKSAFEFQMLYGVRRDLQRQLVSEGFSVRVYVPFGTEWYPYFMRRLAERPANVIFLAKNFFKN
jgi:proline dehydrogenase